MRPRTCIRIFVFGRNKGGRDKVRCLGGSLSDIQSTALRAVLVRSKRPRDVIRVPKAVREICQPNPYAVRSLPRSYDPRSGETIEFPTHRAGPAHAGFARSCMGARPVRRPVGVARVAH